MIPVDFPRGDAPRTRSPEAAGASRARNPPALHAPLAAARCTRAGRRLSIEGRTMRLPSLLRAHATFAPMPHLSDADLLAMLARDLERRGATGVAVGSDAVSFDAVAMPINISPLARLDTGEFVIRRDERRLRIEHGLTMDVLTGPAALCLCATGGVVRLDAVPRPVRARGDRGAVLPGRRRRLVLLLLGGGWPRSSGGACPRPPPRSAGSCSPRRTAARRPEPAYSAAATRSRPIFTSRASRPKATMTVIRIATSPAVPASGQR